MLNIYLCVCVCAPAIGFYASTYNRFRDFYYICSVFLPKAKPRACIPIVIIHSFILILVVSTIFFSLSLFCALAQTAFIDHVPSTVFLRSTLNFNGFVYKYKYKAQASFLLFIFSLFFFPVQIQQRKISKKKFCGRMMAGGF